MKRSLWTHSVFAALTCVPVSLCLSSASAESISFRQDIENKLGVYTLTDDTFLESKKPYLNRGATSYLDLTDPNGDPHVSTMRGLIRFNGLDALAKSVSRKAVKVESANLSLVVLSVRPVALEGVPLEATVSAYAVQPVDANWVEGDTVGEVQSGSSSWAEKFETGVGPTGQAWAGGEGMGDPGAGTYSADPIGVATLDLRDVTPQVTVIEVPLDAATVQNWIDDPSSNGGVAITLSSSNIPEGHALGIALFSSEAGRTDFPASDQAVPTLTIQYAPAKN